MSRLPIRLVCDGCGYAVPAEEPFPFRCPRVRPGDDVDHLLRRRLDAAALPAGAAARKEFLAGEDNPFLRYRRFLYGYQTGRALGLGDGDYVRLAAELDAAVAAVAGHGFRVTPFGRDRELGAELGFGRGGEVWIKDETGNVGGTHKGRHFMGVLLWLEVARRLELPLGSVAEPRTLAVASCGNAALAASLLARAAGRRLEVFVPPDVRRRVTHRLAANGAEIVHCPRGDGETGDPCLEALDAALEHGLLPFSCQGSHNGLVIEGGETLVWEMLSSLLAAGRELDHLVIQVGGGALASASIQALFEARELGVIRRLPRVHTVQTRGAYPLRRAWRRLAGRILGLPAEDEPGRPPRPEDDATIARTISEAVRPVRIERAMRYAAGHRSEFMWPWEDEPKSVARGILDDETYDWRSVVGGMLRTGGLPLVVSENRLRTARKLARERTGIAVDATGTAGLAGLLTLRRIGAVAPGDSAAVLFTGVSRSPVSRHPSGQLSNGER